MDIVEKIYQYDNYREFLADYFEEMKIKQKRFSFRYFASKAGFKSPNFCYYLIKGNRNVSEKSIPKLAQALELKSQSEEYFQYMVKYTQAKDTKEKESYFYKMYEIKKKTDFYKISSKDYKYLENWYIPIIKELVVLDNWDNDFEKLGKMVFPQISAKEVQKAVEVLEELNLIKKISQNRYEATKHYIDTSSIPSFILNNIKKSHIENSIVAMKELPIDKRYISGISLTLDKDGYNKAIKIIKDAQKELINLSKENKFNSSYQINFQIYPTSIDVSGGDDEQH